MTPEQYEQVRGLFFAMEELDSSKHASFLEDAREKYGELIFDELTSLLKEHHPNRARREGSNPETFRYITSAKDALKLDSTSSALEEDDLATRSSKSGRDLDQTSKDPAPQQVASNFLLKSQTRKSRRRNNTWLWITALLPTALIGWITYAQVHSTMKQAVQDEMRGVSDSVSHAARRFLSDKSHLVESWTREPEIQNAVHLLVDHGSNQELDPNQLNASQNIIADQLRRLSGVNTVQFAVWDSENHFRCSNLPALISQSIREERDIQTQLDRAKKGDAVIFGPFKNPEPSDVSPNNPEMGVLTAVRNENNSVLAIMLVTRIGMYQEFSRMFFDIANAGNLDAYAVNEIGTMLTESPRAATLASSKRLDVTVEEIGASLRVADPGFPIQTSNHKKLTRSSMPLTRAAASVVSGRSEGEIEPYRNYAGIEVVGSWRWNSDSGIGVIVERSASQAFATVQIVQAGFILLGSLLFLSVTIAAAFLARATAAERAAVHPLSRYKVCEEVGAGGMGLVFRAKHQQLGRDTALKVMIGGTQRKEDQMRFDREARLAASLSNPHSVTIYDYGRSEDGESYCVMEFLRGLTLQEVVDRSGYQPLGRVLFILRQVCEAVAEAHQKRLLHLDIKPQNIMLSLDQAVGDWAVLFDYGLSKPITPTLEFYSSPSARWSGTPMYMAPERFHHLDQVDQRSDIYSLGCVAYFLATGSTPFFDSDPESLLTLIINQNPIDLTTRRGEEVPAEFAKLILKCMAKKSEDRFGSIEDFIIQIENLQTRFPWTTEDSRRWWLQHGNESDAKR